MKRPRQKKQRGARFSPGNEKRKSQALAGHHHSSETQTPQSVHFFKADRLKDHPIAFFEMFTRDKGLFRTSGNADITFQTDSGIYFISHLLLLKQYHCRNIILQYAGAGAFLNNIGLVSTGQA
jgi:hypothetical protein